MKIASKPETQLTSEEKKRLKIFNAEAKTLELSTRMNVPTSFKHDLESALLENEAFSPNRQSGGFVRKDVIKSEFEADYLLAYRFRQGMSDLVYSTDSDLSALGGTTCLSVRYFGIEKKQTSKKKSSSEVSTKKKSDKYNDNTSCSTLSSLVYNISGCSNGLMNRLSSHVKST